MSVDERDLTDWANLSYDEVISSTMAQNTRKQSKSFTPLRRKRATGKNLSHSFSLISGNIEDHIDSRKGTNFYRSDSGFTESEETNREFGQCPNDQMMDVSMRSNY